MELRQRERWLASRESRKQRRRDLDGPQSSEVRIFSGAISYNLNVPHEDTAA